MKSIELATDAAGAAKAAAVASGVGTALTWDMSVAFVGVPVTVLFAALLGAALGVAYGDPIPERRRQLATAIVNSFIGAGFSAILPFIPHMSWVGKAPAAAVALLLGFVARWVVPIIVERLPALLRGVKVRADGGDSSGGGS